MFEVTQPSLDCHFASTAVFVGHVPKAWAKSVYIIRANNNPHLFTRHLLDMPVSVMSTLTPPFSD